MQRPCRTLNDSQRTSISMKRLFKTPLIPAALLTLLTSSAGCIDSVDAEQNDMCRVASDCRSADHICDEGVCWGDPPDPSQFAAVLIPPADRSDLAPVELTQLSIAVDGTITGMQFGETILLHGRVELGCGEEPVSPKSDAPPTCVEGTLIPAQITIERSASFKGGPTYRRTVLTNIEVGPEEDSFSIPLPKDGAEYRVTVVPDELSLESIAVGDAQIQAPPFSTLIRSNEDAQVRWELGTPEQLKEIQGCIVDTEGNGQRFQGMRVTALGKWTSLSKSTRASSIVTTDARGCFQLSVPIDMGDEFDIVVKPGPGITLPTLRLSGEYVRDPDPENPNRIPHVIAPLIMPNVSSPISVTVPLLGRSGGGNVDPISGATIMVDTVFEKPSAETRNVTINYVAQGVSNGIGEASPGIATIDLFPGTAANPRDYRIRVFSPADSEYASIFNGTVSVGNATLFSLDEIHLDRRIPVSGTITDAYNQPLPSTPLRVLPSSQLKSELTSPFERTILDNLQFPNELTTEDGEFLIWLDPELIGLFARYDFSVAPPDFSSAPRWVFHEISVDAEPGESVDLGTLPLPPASYARGSIRDSEGFVVPGAEIRWFQLPTDSCEDISSTYCNSLAQPIGIWESDESGEVIAVLPDPVL